MMFFTQKGNGKVIKVKKETSVKRTLENNYCNQLMIPSIFIYGDHD